MERTIYRACPLCEAICGLEIKTRDREIVSIRGDRDDPFSRGHICPKAVALQDIQDDPDRLRRPLKKIGNGWQEIGWDEALDEVTERLFSLREAHGPDSLGIYLGNPNVHNLGAMTHGPLFYKMLRTKNRYSATSVDQLPHQLVSYLMYGHQFLLPVPDIDHTDYMLILGANPLVSNGSMMTCPDVKARLKAIQERGGKVVVIDPRRSETARMADHHHFIRPGGDTALLLALLKILLETVNPDRRSHLSGHLEKLDQVEDMLASVEIADCAASCGIAVGDIQSIADDLATAGKAACYGRLGVSVTENGTLNHWLIQMINIVTGNLDRVGGTLVTDPAVDLVGMRLMGPGGYGRWRSRVNNLPEACSELPVSELATEILTPGDGQIRGLITTAGNPVLSTPNGRKLDDALEQLDFMVSIDLYLNETTRHADIILPPTAPLEHDHYDISFLALAVRNVTRYSEAVFDKPEGTLHEWEIFDQLTRRMTAKMDAPVTTRSRAPARMVNLSLAYGPYGKRRRAEAGLSLKKLQNSPHGIDLGPLKPGLLKKLRTRGQKIDCLPDLIREGLTAFLKDLTSRPKEGLLLIGRRHLRSNNSWMHNYERLVKGKERCTLLVHPDDMARCGLTDGDYALLQSRVAKQKVLVEASEEMMPGTVSLPHGWGHNRAGLRLAVAAEHAGVSVNDFTDEMQRDPIAGTSALNGVSVRLSPI
ncbi:molybdopterin-dependent oxidoreductase [Emcibacter nanhaiensis]|uniref:Molybdopterin oxidoreductase family protein n=1 Tax=Emcibacter nanhaiensis TaxID=1505037 RepID=A0A501PRJ6_9PROT|nr:molybdopterin-dependent oxidoreductase [Emcibacter nanhaiensis]TPD63149.1 molybdopterin oxidoreductase family protein [Emcibacter nanhaiensis]